MREGSGGRIPRKHYRSRREVSWGNAVNDDFISKEGEKLKALTQLFTSNPSFKIQAECPRLYKPSSILVPLGTTFFPE